MATCPRDSWGGGGAAYYLSCRLHKTNTHPVTRSCPPCMPPTPGGAPTMHATYSGWCTIIIVSTLDHKIYLIFDISNLCLQQQPGHPHSHSHSTHFALTLTQLTSPSLSLNSPHLALTLTQLTSPSLSLTSPHLALTLTQLTSLSFNSPRPHSHSTQLTSPSLNSTQLALTLTQLTSPSLSLNSPRMPCGPRAHSINHHSPCMPCCPSPRHLPALTPHALWFHSMI